MKAKIQTKVILFLGGMLILSTAVTVVLNTRQQSQSLKALDNESNDAICWSLTNLIEQVMLAGANERLQPLAEELVKEGVRDELTIVNSSGIVARSSDKALIGKEATDRLWQVLLKSGRDSTFKTEYAGKPVNVTYKLFANEHACQDCHDIDEEPVLGGFKMVKSEEQIAAAVAGGRSINMLLGALSALVVIVGSVWILRSMVFRPLRVVHGKLQQAASGDINQRLEARSSDEIGLFIRSLQELINYVRGFADASDSIAQGDLRVKIEPRSSDDRLGISYQKMVANLDQMVGDLSESAEQLSTAANEITATSDRMSQGAKNQSDQINQVSAAVEEMSAGLTETSNGTEHMRTLSQSANQKAGEGGDKVGRTIESMEAIAKVVEDSSESIRSLSQSADQIQSVVTVISDIADQTNLLALNAAIEAARAGEQGRGFAVVADEVRKLAEKTARATDEISQTVKGIQRGTENAVASMNQSVEQVAHGQSLAREAGVSLEQILATITQVDLTIQQITAAATEQSATSEEIAKSTAGIAEVTRESAQGAEESARAAEQLNEQAERLLGIVKRFTRRGPAAVRN